jgi:hypothetical protein
MSLQALLKIHAAAYGAESELRVAAWLRRDVQTAMLRSLPGADDSELDETITSPPISESRRTDRWLAPAEVAERLHLAKKTLANWRSKKEGPAWFRHGGRVFYLESIINAWKYGQPDGGKS